jgi:hypothetical protein
MKADTSDSVALEKAIDLAVDYRGDVTITLVSTGESIACYIYDRRRGRTADETLIRALPRESNGRLSIPQSDIARIEFTGRDTAAGRSFETWMKKYVEKKLAGERASIESESLDQE